jgi:hypothetical protein
MDNVLSQVTGTINTNELSFELAPKIISVKKS